MEAAMAVATVVLAFAASAGCWAGAADASMGSTL
jgi:hypothetical protein